MSLKSCLSACLLALPLSAGAAAGLMAPRADTLWPAWQARITVQTANVSPLSRAQLLDGRAGTDSWQGAALLGDYYFATPRFGGFRASGGLMVGARGGAPLLAAPLGAHLGLTLQASGQGVAYGADRPGSVPYVGLGFSSAPWWQSLSLSADIGWVAEQPAAAVGTRRVLFGTQGRETAWQELRLSPLLQLGLRYTF